uniref:PDZ domain-containing protein n=1 Tax=Timema monikensis TaxID=170555 RepID=A0A7R9EHW2_9NEOP|nr:unnamed protein product [Timema monikensis]
MLSSTAEDGDIEVRISVGVNDRIFSANNISLENVEYATAVQVLRDSGNTVTLVVRRRVVLPVDVNDKEEDFGLVLGCKIYVREVANKALQENKDGSTVLQEGDVLLKINNHKADGMSLKEAKKLIDSSKERLNLVVRREHRPTTASQESTALPKGLALLSLDTVNQD